MGDLERVADARRGRANPIGSRQLVVKQLVHPSQKDHVGINQDDALKLGQTEYPHFRPRIVESRESGVEARVLARGGHEMGHVDDP